MSYDTYVRYPHIRGDRIVFVAQDDLWLVGSDGGHAHRITDERVPVQSPRLSPDGTRVAWTATRGGRNEAYVVPVEGGVVRQLTHWGQQRTVVRGWLDDEHVLVLSTAGEAHRFRIFTHSVPIDGGPSRRLPYGWADDLAFGPEGGVLLSTPTLGEPAWRKRYRGGTASQLWLDLTGEGTFRRIFSDLTSGLVSPMWTTESDGRQHLGFISDHDGLARVYGATVGKRAPATSRLRRLSDGEFYARHATTDGHRVVYVAGGSLYLIGSLAGGAAPEPVEVGLGGSRSGRRRRPLDVDAAKLGTLSPDRTGRASAVEVRGSIWWLAHRDGPARGLATGSQVRRRLPVVLGESRVAWVSDSEGDDSVEVVDLGGPDATPRRLVAPGRVGRVLEMAASPDGRRLAVATHDGRVMTCAVPAGEVSRTVSPNVLDSATGDMAGLAFSPDSRWLAWSASGPGPWEEPGPLPLRQIKIADLTRGRVWPVTSLRFTDTEPVFTRDGKHLAFLSVRSLDPVYDAYAFDLSFPAGCRPHLVPLAAETPSPFAPVVGGAPPGPSTQTPAGGSEPPATAVDLDGLEERVTEVPVEAGRYSRLAAVSNGLAWLREPLLGQTGESRPRAGDQPERARIEHLDLRTGRLRTLVPAADRFSATGDGTRLVVLDGKRMVLVPADRPVEDAPGGSEAPDADEKVEVALDRLRVEVDPPAEWRQMYDEAWRLMRDHFWRADMGGVDWASVRQRYLPLLDRIATHDDLVDLLWEMQGELATSHAYVIPQPAPEQGRGQGLLGADLEYARGQWRVRRVVPGDSSDRRARSPLSAPGVNVHAGDAVVAVDGRATSRASGPLPMLAGAADTPVELTIRPRGGGEERRMVVVPLADEMALRYQDWVRDRRDYVHSRTGATVGYLHVPDMMAPGWAQLHRDLRTELSRDAVIVDVRGNGGGHTSQLVVEKLARRIIGWDLVRGYGPESYPRDARRGPMVALADMFAGSDGDIVTAAIRSLGLGTVVGTRTWGGVVGIDDRYRLVDQTLVTQPRFAFWFSDFGWGVENHGVDPDIEVVAAPQHRVRREDPQLDHALELVRRQLRKQPPAEPPEIPSLGS